MCALKTDPPGNVDQLINRQMTLWDVRQKLSREGGELARRELAHLKEGPWITLSRQSGSGGTALAGILAGKLGWQVFDKEILAAIARHDPAREKILSLLDEHAVSALQDCLSRLMDPGAVSRSVYAHDVAQIIFTLARQGRAILVGRGANWLLDPRYGLRVRVVAPLPFRAERIAGRRGIDLILAEQALRGEDVEVAAFIRQLYRREIDDATGYDLVLNLGHLETEAAADAVVTALRRKLGAPA